VVKFMIHTTTTTNPFNGPLSRTTWVSWFQKGTTNLDFTEARDSEWQWHQLGHMQVCTSLQTDNHAGTPPLSFLLAGCPSCCSTNSVKALKDSDTWCRLNCVMKFFRWSSHGGFNPHQPAPAEYFTAHNSYNLAKLRLTWYMFYYMLQFY